MCKKDTLKSMASVSNRSLGVVIKSPKKNVSAGKGVVAQVRGKGKAVLNDKD